MSSLDIISSEGSFKCLSFFSAIMEFMIILTVLQATRDSNLLQSLVKAIYCWRTTRTIVYVSYWPRLAQVDLKINLRLGDLFLALAKEWKILWQKKSICFEELDFPEFYMKRQIHASFGLSLQIIKETFAESFADMFY